MIETLQEFFDSRGVPIRVEREAGVIRGVKILGLKSRNGRTYLPEALEQAVRLYEDAKVNVNHPKGRPGAPRDYQDRIGIIRSVSARGGDGLFADFHFNPKHVLAEQLIWDAEHTPENVGFSHNVEAHTARRDGQVVVEAITRVQSVDLVADPATTRGLFESAAAGSESHKSCAEANVQAVLTALTAEELKVHRPDLVEELCRQPAAELARLQGEIGRLTALESMQQKRDAARRLLRQFNLPEPEAVDARSKAITSARFMETLLAAESEQAMCELIEERLRLVRTLSGTDASRRAHEGGPLSRDQHLVDGVAPLDTKAFVRAIT